MKSGLGIIAKRKTVLKKLRKKPDAGDVWLWVAVDADTRLVPSRRLGHRLWDGNDLVVLWETDEQQRAERAA
jgi:hypothetical protein